MATSGVTPTIDDLGGAQKAAILMIALGQDESAAVMQRLSPKEIEALTVQIGMTNMVPAEMRLEVLREFRMLTLARQYIVQGGLQYAKSILSMMMDDDSVERLIGRAQRVIDGNPFQFMEEAPADNLIEILRHEHPQTISLILANLSPGQSGSILQGLPPEIKLDVIKRIAGMDQIDSEVLALLHRSLKDKISTLLSTSQNRVGGTEQVAEILNIVDSTSERQIMAGIQAENPELAEQIQSLMFTFEELTYVDRVGLQKVIAQVDQNDLILALRMTTDELKDKLLNSVSERVRGDITETLETMGRVALKDVEEAQQKILEATKRLEEEGEILIMREADEGSFV